MSEEKIPSDTSGYNRDTPVGRPDVDGRGGVFVPSAEFDLENSTSIRKGAGIVGYVNSDGTLTLYFEANRFHDSDLRKWENKVRKAYDRMVMCAPTVSKTKLPANMVEQIGYIDGTGINVKNLESLMRWLELSGAADTAPEHPLIEWR